MIKKVRKWILYVILGFLLLGTGLYIALQFSSVQNYLKDKALVLISEKYQADWSIGTIQIDFFDEVVLEDILFLDQQNDTLLMANRLHVDISLFSIFSKNIHLDRIEIDGMNSKLYNLEGERMNYEFLFPTVESQDLALEQDSESSAWTYMVDLLRLSDARIYYRTNSQEIDFSTSLLNVEIDDFDLLTQKLNVENVQISNAAVKIDSYNQASKQEPFALPNMGWKIDLHHLEIDDSDLKMLSDSPIKSTNLHLSLKDVLWQDSLLKVDVENVKGDFLDNINLKNAQGEIVMIEDQLQINNLKLETSNDVIAANALTYNFNTQGVSANSLVSKIGDQTLRNFRSFIPKSIRLIKQTELNLAAETITYDQTAMSAQNLLVTYGKAIQLNADLSLTNLRSSDIEVNGNLNQAKSDLVLLDFMLDDLNIPDSLSQFRNLKLSGLLRGSKSKMNVSQLAIQLDEVFSAELSGLISNLNDSDKVFFDVAFSDMKADIDQLPIPTIEGLALDSLGIANFVGDVRGGVNALELNGELQSNLGNLVTAIRLNNLQDFENLSYQGKVEMKGFDIGTLLQRSDLDKISISSEVDGVGVDFANMNARVKGTISDFSYNDYNYADIDIDAFISDSKIDGHVELDDSNIKLNYDGVISFVDRQSIFQFETLIDTVNLQALGFYNKALNLKGLIKSDLRLPLRKNTKGYLDIYNLEIDNSKEVFYEDSILMSAVKSSDSTYIDVRSDFMSLDIDGQFGIRELPKALMSMADHYINLDSVMVEDYESKSVKMIGSINTLKPLDVILANTLVQSKQIDMDVDFDFTNYQIEGMLTADSLFYDEYFSRETKIDITTQSKTLSVDVLAKDNIANNVEIPIVSLKNCFKNQQLFSTLLAKDDDALPKLRFSTIIENTDRALTISLEDSLILNSKEWSASKDNFMEFSNDRIYVSELTLTDQNEYLKVYSSDESGQDLIFDFRNFNIGQFTTLLTSEPSKLVGNIDGKVEIRNITSDLYFVVNAQVDDITYDSTAVGELTVKAEDNPISGIVEASVSLKGPRNDIIGSGTYNTNDRATDFDVDINNFQLMLLDPFLSEIMKDSKGDLAGRLTVDGTIDRPIIDGSVVLDKAVTTIAINNARYAIDKHKITFDNDAIDIGVLDLYDTNDNVASISGKIYHNFLEDIRLDLAIDTDKFMFLNTQRSDNPIFFGKLVLDMEGTIIGPISLLDVDVSAKTLENTLVTLSPLSSESFVLEEPFITYGKPDQDDDQTSEYLLKLARAFPFKVNLLMNVTNEAELNMVLDPVTGDKIVGKGKGDLRIVINPDGNQEIYGTYTVSEGSYNFSYGDFVSKEFKINEGGTVKFIGDPLGAVLDIDAVYNVYTTTYELIKNETSIDDSELEAAKRRTNVEVYLSLNGSINAPVINLDIKVPELQSSNLVSSIDRKLNELRNDANELNSQVFGLLLFDSFLLSDNASAGFGSIGNNIALSSVSNLITNQLNKFADKAIKGVDVNVNFNSYDSSYANNGSGGNVTEIGLEVSKRLFNERLKISAGGNLDLVGDGTSESYSSFIGDFVIEYKLTESGNYRLRVFSKSNFDRIASENNNRNGVSIFYSKTFDSKTDAK